MDVQSSDGMVWAERICSWRHPPRLYGAGRVCDVPGCRTLLSIYNGSTYCSVHEPWSPSSSSHRVHRGPRATTGSRAA